jgi:hypothetical protein
LAVLEEAESMIAWVQTLIETMAVTCLALLTGGALLSLVADEYKPEAVIPHRLFPLAALFSGLVTVVPVLRLVFFWRRIRGGWMPFGWGCFTHVPGNCGWAC